MVSVMSITTHFHRLCTSLRSFRTAERGNVILTFALALVPMVAFVGAAVDYSHANSIKAAMQAAIDSTALMLSKDAASLTGAQIQTKASDYFAALFTRPETKNVMITATYSTQGGSTVVVNGTGTMDTAFMGLMGFKQLTINATSTAAWGNTRLRVALVLDNTGSMQQNGKIGALQTATKNLLTTLQAAATKPEDVYVSIIPFSKDVNVASSNYNQNWIDWTDWKAANGSCSKSSHTSQSTCQSNNGTWTPKTPSANNWNGCVTDRGPLAATGAAGVSPNNYDQLVDAPIPGNVPSLYPAEQYSSCSQQLMALSNDWSGMTTLVNNMSPNGNTNQGVGLAWGWVSLAGSGPLTAPAIDATYQYQQVIILLTDGLNTQDRWYTNQSQIDARMIAADGSGLCKNIKAAGITLYTVQVNTSGDPTSLLLKNCATDSSKFFLLTSSSAIVTTFNQIGTNLSRLRIAK
jgi:Flp pilus assembly protein TadG